MSMGLIRTLGIVGCASLVAVGCADSGAGGNGGTGGMGGDVGGSLEMHTVKFLNSCQQQIWLASNVASPAADSDWALAPACTNDMDCADGQTCDAGACTCASDDDCAFGADAGTPSAKCNTIAGQCISEVEVQLPAGWQGRFWGRTGCSGSSSSFACDSGQCGVASGSDFDCGANGDTANQATLFELAAAGESGTDNYDVSLVSGYNLPISVVAALPPNESRWKANTSYTAGTVIIEKIGRDVFGFTAGGVSPATSGTAKPAFSGTWTEQTTDGSGGLFWTNVGPMCQRSGCDKDLLLTCPSALQSTSGQSCDAPANVCVPAMEACNDDLPYYQCQNNAGPTDLFSNVLNIQSPNAETYVCFSAADCPAGTSCTLDPTFKDAGFKLPSEAGLCLPVTQNGGCLPSDDGKPCPASAFPFVEYQCQTLADGGANLQVCVPPITSGFGNLWWNAANWSQVMAPVMCSDDDGCTGDQKCLEAPTMGGARQCSGSDCTCYESKPCGTGDSGANDGCPGPDQCLNSVGVPNGTSDVECADVTCYCGPQGIYSGVCGPTNPEWNTAAGNVGNWASVFKDACPIAYSYQFDDPSSNWSCPNPSDGLVNYEVEFCLINP